MEVLTNNCICDSLIDRIKDSKLLQPVVISNKEDNCKEKEKQQQLGLVSINKDEFDVGHLEFCHCSAQTCKVKGQNDLELGGLCSTPVTTASTTAMMGKKGKKKTGAQ